MSELSEIKQKHNEKKSIVDEYYPILSLVLHISYFVTMMFAVIIIYESSIMFSIIIMFGLIILHFFIFGYILLYEKKMEEKERFINKIDEVHFTPVTDRDIEYQVSSQRNIKLTEDVDLNTCKFGKINYDGYIYGQGNTLTNTGYSGIFRDATMCDITIQYGDYIKITYDMYGNIVDCTNSRIDEKRVEEYI